MFLIVLASLITLIVCLAQIISFRRLYNYVDAELKRKPSAYQPKLAVVLPCKGVDPGFADNLQRLLSQDYGDFEVIFAVAQETDSAYPYLQNAIKEAHKSFPNRKAQVVIAGVSDKCAQKLNNQLKALSCASPDREVFVFVDSDVIAREDFLSCLIAPLEDPSVGISTGYRFYIASKNNWASLVRALWNRMTAWELANPNLAYAWGGAMAIRKPDFERLDVRGSWQKAATDDMSMTTLVKDAGMSVRFVPQCLVASDGDSDVAEIFDWTNRQLILTKVYYPKLWRKAIARATVMAIWLITILIAGVGGLISQNPDWLLATVIGLTILPIELWFLIRAQNLWQRVIPDRKQYINDSLASFCVVLPLAHLVLPWMTLFSVLTNRIQWRGIIYDLRAPDNVVVVRA
ncbi:MAG: glycosyltransferase family 2 protein [Candidatus Obscuribacterales bacterium]|nr:glycosyltransferase family 2 protein [Candidatus Obscuribacterales bacterium]